MFRSAQMSLAAGALAIGMMPANIIAGQKLAGQALPLLIEPRIPLGKGLLFRYKSSHAGKGIYYLPIIP